MDSILANGTWDITDRPYGCKPVGCKCVFKKKLRPDGTIEKYKARLVAKVIPRKKVKTSLILTPSTTKELTIIPEPTIAMEQVENPVEGENGTHVRSKIQRTAKLFGDDFIVYLMDDTPRTISEACAPPDADYWKEVVRSEMDSILANGTWEITDRPYG